jgi:hypothetical protein
VGWQILLRVAIMSLILDTELYEES